MRHSTKITTHKRLAGHSGLLTALVCVLAIGFVTAASAVAAGVAEVKLEGTGTGTVASSPSGIDCTDIGGPTTGECSTTEFPFLGHVELTATPGPGSQFEGWRGNEFVGECQSGTTNPCGYTEGGLTYEVIAIFGSGGSQQPLTAILVACLITTPFWPTIVVGIRSLEVHRVPWAPSSE